MRSSPETPAFSKRARSRHRADDAIPSVAASVSSSDTPSARYGTWLLRRFGAAGGDGWTVEICLPRFGLRIDRRRCGANGSLGIGLLLAPSASSVATAHLPAGRCVLPPAGLARRS